MTNGINAKTYRIDNYLIEDLYNDHVLTRKEVHFEENGTPRDLNDLEWDKFRAQTDFLGKNRFMVLNKSGLNGETILNILEANPLLLNDLIREAGGSAYLEIILENYFSGASGAVQKSAVEKLNLWKQEFKSLYARMASLSKEEQLLLLSNFILNNNSTRVLEGFLTKEELKKIPKDKKRDEKIAVKLLEKISRDPKLLEEFMKLYAIGYFVFAQKKIQYSFEATLNQALLEGKADCDRFAAIYVFLGKEIGLDFKLYKFNDHVTLIALSEVFPKGRLFIESTNGTLYDPELYKQDPQIQCLQLIGNLNAYERSAETSIVSVLVQRANDIIDGAKSDQFKEAKRLLVIADQLQPEDVNILLLLQMICSNLSQMDEAEQYRLKTVQLVSKWNRK